VCTLYTIVAACHNPAGLMRLADRVLDAHV